MDAVIGIDVGTAGAKGCLLGDGLSVLATAQRGYGVLTPAPGWVEQDPAEWLRSVREIIRELGAKARITGISISSQGDTIVPVDAAGKPLRHAISWMDSRCSAQCDRIAKQISPTEWFELTGEHILPFLAATKIMWIEENEPETARRTYKYLFTEDFISAYLTGRYVVSASNGTRSGLANIASKAWDERLLALTGVDVRRLSEIADSGVPVGHVRPEVACELGLPAEAVVSTGGHDQPCAALGAGVTDEGECLLSCGSAWVVLAPMRQLPSGKAGSQGSMTKYCHCLPNRWVLLGAYAGGAILKWFRDNLSEPVIEEAEAKGKDAYELLAEPGSVGDLLFFPHFYGAITPAWRSEARGALLGLRLHHRRKDIARAILLGVAFDTAWNVEALRQDGCSVTELTMVGGGARSSFWAQLVADAANLPVRLPQETEGAALGAAMLAGLGTGSLDLGRLESWKPPTRQVVEPDPAGSHRLAPLFDLYKRTFYKLLDVYRELQKAAAPRTD